MKFCFAILLLHGSHRSYLSRRRDCLHFVKTPTQWQLNLNCSWVWHENDFANPTTETKCLPSGASYEHLLTTTKYNGISNNKRTHNININNNDNKIKIWRFGLASQILIHFDHYLRIQCIFFKPDFCIEIWVPWTL